MKPIETTYKGYRFRSRLEARWAVFFDHLDLQWEYEKEGYNLDDGIFYLPDFWLPQLKCFVEIKGQEPTEEEMKKCEALARACITWQGVYVLIGSIPLPPRESPCIIQVQSFRKGENIRKTENIKWVECPCCAQIGLARYGHLVENYFCDCPEMKLISAMESLCDFAPEGSPRGSWWQKKVDQIFYADDSPRLIEAYTAARQARFEHRS